MSRVLLQIVLPLIAPVLIYGIWSAIDRRNRGLVGLPGWEEGRWFWAAMSGFGLVVVILIATMILNHSNDGTYVPARLEDGRVVPGEFRLPTRRATEPN